MAAYPADSACTGARASADAADADGPMIAPHSMHVATIIFPAFTAASLTFEPLMNARARLQCSHQLTTQLLRLTCVDRGLQ